MFIKTFPHLKPPDSKDCGYTCLWIISKHYGKLISIKKIREISGTTRKGSRFDLSTKGKVLLDGLKIKPKKMFLRESTFYLAVSFDDEPGFLIFRNPF